MLSFFSIIIFVFDDVFIVEKDAYPFRPLIRMGRVEEWGKMDKTIVPSLFPSCIWKKWILLSIETKVWL